MALLSAHPGITNTEPVITIDGQNQVALSRGLLSLTVSETIEGLFQCAARFGNWGDRDQGIDFLYFDTDLLEFGQEIVVSLSAGNQKKEVFKGKITAIEGQFAAGEPPQIQILAEDAAQAMRQTRRTRTFEEISEVAVLEQIASDHGLKADIKVTDNRYPVIAQLNQSDLAFVRERARHHAAEVWIENDTLHVQEREKREQPDEPLTLTLNLGLIEFGVIADTANQYSKVAVSGWNMQTKEKISYTATDSVLGRELAGQVSGGQIVARAFSDRTDRIAQQMPLTPEEAQTIAESSFRAQARRFVVGKGLARGDARIRVGRAIDFKGLGSLFSGTYIVCEVYHQFCRGPDGGYTTELVVERAGLNSNPKTRS